MDCQKFQSGAFVFTRARGLEPQDPEQLKPLAIKHSINPSFIPPYAGDRTAFGRAILQARKGLAKDGILLRPIKRTGSEVIYGIVKEEKNEIEKRLDHDFEATVSWSLENDLSQVCGDHPVAEKVRASFASLRGKVVSDDWSSAVTAYLLSHDAAPVRGDGRVYWVPPQRIQPIKQLGSFLAEIGINLIFCELEAESQPIIKDVARQSLDEQLEHLQHEVDQFDGTQKPSTYAKRLKEYQRLKNRAVLYREALGLGVDHAQKVLTELEQKVSAMLDIRKKTVVHRKDPGTPENARSSLAPRPSIGLRLVS